MRTNQKKQKEVLYIAFDVEAAGPRLGVHSTLSVGACAVSREALSYEEYAARGLLFYAELKPHSLQSELAAMRVGCSQLECLEGLRHNPLLDPEHKAFHAPSLLAHMERVCEDRDAADERFRDWFFRVKGEREVIPLFDTTLFDPARVSLWLDEHCPGSPLGHSGRDLKSIYQGYTGRRNAKLREIQVPRNQKPHHAGHDAVELAQKGSIVLFNRLGF